MPSKTLLDFPNVSCHTKKPEPGFVREQGPGDSGLSKESPRGRDRRSQSRLGERRQVPRHGQQADVDLWQIESPTAHAGLAVSLVTGSESARIGLT